MIAIRINWVVDKWQSEVAWNLVAPTYVEVLQNTTVLINFKKFTEKTCVGVSF